MSDLRPSPDASSAPVLSYATPEADALPDWVPAAEALIDANKPPDALRKLFRTSLQAAKYYAKSQARRFGPQQLGSSCIACGTETSFACTTRWRVQVQFKTAELKVSGKTSDAIFQTMHSICAPCYQHWVRRTYRFALPAALFTWTVLAIWIMLIITRFVFRPFRGPIDQWILPTIVVTWIVVVIGRMILKFLANRSTPRAIRKIFRGGVSLESIGELFDRKDVYGARAEISG